MNHPNTVGSFPRGCRIVRVSWHLRAYPAVHQIVSASQPRRLELHQMVLCLRRAEEKITTILFSSSLGPTSRTTMPNENTSEARVGRVPGVSSLLRTSGAHQRIICCEISSGAQTTEAEPKSVNAARPSSLTKMAPFRRQSAPGLSVEVSDDSPHGVSHGRRSENVGT